MKLHATPLGTHGKCRPESISAWNGTGDPQMIKNDQLGRLILVRDNAGIGQHIYA